MKVFIDIYHLPQYNFFRNAIKKLGPEDIDLGCVNRGKLAEIIRHECPEFKLYVLGDYKKNKGRFSMAFRIIIPRILRLIKLFKKNKYNVIGTAHYQANIAARLIGIPNFSILDDPREGVLQLVKLFSDEFYLPNFSGNFGKIKRFNALKEWAYLSPRYFKPSNRIVKNCGLKQKKYLFIREVSTNTSNYLSQDKNLVLQLSKSLDNNIKVILSLENKKLKDLYPKNWIILEEPVSDIHSLMYYSKLVISSGDSMAREGGMLGVPSIYLGNREMPANQILIDKNILFKKDIDETIDFINNKLDNFNINQEEFRLGLEKDWDDVTELILHLINKKK